MDVQVGDTVKVTCKDYASYLPDSQKVFIGVVTEVFDNLTQNLEEGINLRITIRGPVGQWFLYKPSIDKGTLEVLERKDNER